jgi:predicted AAA+ superfamily ATPase
MIKRFLEIPNQSFFLFGPRGTGKSTWLKATFPNAYFIDLLDPTVQIEYLTDPGKLLQVVRSLKNGTDVIIDEVQKVPELLSAVHVLIEEKRGWRFILTGSSARKLRRTGADLLAGRGLLLTMHPFMATELGSIFSLEHALTHGTVASVTMAPSPQDALKAYITIYLREEVQQEALVRNLSIFNRFLHTISFSQASQVNSTSIGRECGVDRKTIDAWIQILEDLLISTTIFPFTKRAARALATHPKFFFFDCGVYRSLRPKGPLDLPAEIDGVALESLVFQHFKAWNAYHGSETEIFFWRTRTGIEVDFIIYGERDFWAIEVKNTNRIRPEDLKGLKIFKSDYPESKQILLYRGSDHLLINDITCIPIDFFLQNLYPSVPIDNLLKR